MANDTKVNLEWARKAIKKNSKFVAGMKLLSKRQRGRRDTTFRRWERIIEDMVEAKKLKKRWTPSEIREFFEIHQKAGAGLITLGKDTPKFEWTCHLQAYACAVLELPEPVRRRKDGSIIETYGLRKATPPRKPTLASVDDSGEAREPSGINKKKIAGLFAELMREIDMQKLSPAACRKLSDILVELNKDD
jgi:hypothetical protein